MFKYIKKYKKQVFFSLFLVAVMVFTSLAQPKILSIIINDGIMNVDANGIQNPDLDIINKYGTILIIIAVIGLIAGIINTIISSKIAIKSVNDMRKDTFKKIQQFSYADIESFESSNLVVRLTNDMTQIQSLIMMGFQSLIRIPLLFIGAFILAILVLPKLWWIIIVEVIIILIVNIFISKFTLPKFSKFQKNLDKVNSTIKENFEGIRVIKSFVQEEKEIKKFGKENKNLADLNFSIGRNFATLIPVIQFVANITIVVVLVFSKPLIVENVNVIGDMVSFLNYLNLILMALLIGGMLMMQVGRASASSKRINEILNHKSKMKYNKTGIKSIKGNIEFKNVSFKYPHDNENSLHDISFKIKKGQTIGIVGSTGSGKSTLANLVSRLFDCDSGEILIDGVNIKKIPKNVLRNSISTVLQKSILFSGTVGLNIKDGRLNANNKEIESSAKIAQAHEFIETLGYGYNSKVMQRGVNFSGGQKQRISIARGLVKNPKILILDDSTSALDAKSEKLVKQGLDNTFEKCTKIIISQKISSVVNADKIIVLDEGSLIAFDNHKNLVNTCNVYKEIYDSQKGREK
ncbi:MAG: ABC transporter ATP-binding protein [Bacilli bacterium]